MSVFKRGSIFYTDFVINGQRVCKSTGKTTKREAKHVEATERQKLLSGTKEQKVSKLLLSDAIELVYDSKWKNNKDGMVLSESAAVVGAYGKCSFIIGYWKFSRRPHTEAGRYRH